jgi:hypothetical protein
MERGVDDTLQTQVYVALRQKRPLRIMPLNDNHKPN